LWILLKTAKEGGGAECFGSDENCEFVDKTGVLGSKIFSHLRALNCDQPSGWFQRQRFSAIGLLEDWQMADSQVWIVAPANWRIRERGVIISVNSYPRHCLKYL
jgi:hypothetical protein